MARSSVVESSAGAGGGDGVAGRGLTVVVDSLVKTYRTGEDAVLPALDRVSIRVPAGQAVAVTGPSGSGKSTLLHLVGSMDRPDSGSILVGGRDVVGFGERERTGYRRRVGFVFQRFHLLPALTVLDNVIAPVLPYRTAFDKKQRARELLAAVGLGDRTADLPGRLSGGQQQRVAIARALMNDPGLILADEPTGALDSATGADVMDLLLGLRAERGLTLMIATHDLGLAGLCDRRVGIKDGRIVADDGAADEAAPGDPEGREGREGRAPATGPGAGG